MGQEAGVILLYALGMALAVAEIFLPGAVIGLIGLVSDMAFKALNRKLFPWAQLGR